jgi:repressor LexA
MMSILKNKDSKARQEMELTLRQREILNFIQHFIVEQGYPPTIREIATYFGIDYRAALDHLRALEKKGSLARSSKSRGIQLFRPLTNIRHVPVVGRVTAGPPLEAVENMEGTIPIPEEWAKGSGLFIVRVEREGMSMVPTILPHDYLVIKQGSVVEEGAIGLVMLDGEVTVKRIFREGDSFLLKSDNPAMLPIQVRKGEKNLRILGKVVGIAYRKL